MTQKQIETIAYRTARKSRLSVMQASRVQRKVARYLRQFTWLPPHQWEDCIKAQVEIAKADLR